MFPANPNLDNDIEVRQRERFIVNFARTKAYHKSAIPPYCQNLLNTHFPSSRRKGGPDQERGRRGKRRRKRRGG